MFYVLWWSTQQSRNFNANRAEGAEHICNTVPPVTIRLVKHQVRILSSDHHVILYMKTWLQKYIDISMNLYLICDGLCGNQLVSRAKVIHPEVKQTSHGKFGM